MVCLFFCSIAQSPLGINIAFENFELSNEKNLSLNRLYSSQAAKCTVNNFNSI